MCLIMLLAAGCAREEVLGPVTGEVTFKGKAVTEGRVVFSNFETGVFIGADLNEAGAFEVQMAKGHGLPLGEYTVTIEPPLPTVVTGDASKAPVRQFPQLPQKYRQTATSPLRLIVKEGPNPCRFELAP